MRKMIAESVTYDHMTGDTTKVKCYEEPTCIGWHYEVSVETETSFYVKEFDDMGSALEYMRDESGFVAPKAYGKPAFSEEAYK